MDALKGSSPLFLIPARGGSKGVPGKNIRPLGGVPLIVHSIRTALEVADSPDRVVVSTDSEEIAAIAREAGARVPFLRPAQLATDTASSRDVILHAVDTLGHDPSAPVVLLQPTSPFRNPADIQKALQLMAAGCSVPLAEGRSVSWRSAALAEGHSVSGIGAPAPQPSAVVSVRPAASNPYYNAFEAAPDGFLRISKGSGLITRRQDAPPVWEFDGSIYVIDPEALRRAPSIALMPRIIPVVNTHPYNIDIDSPLDFKFAEYLVSQ